MTGIYVTSSFFPVFSSYALNTSLNDYYVLVSGLTRSESESKVRCHLGVPSHGKGTVFQLFGWKMSQNIGIVSGNVGSGGERNRLVAISANRHLPAREIQVYEPSDIV